MNILCSLRGGDRLLIGLPFEKIWSLNATPCDSGVALKLVVDGVEIDLMHGKPVDLQHTLELKPYEQAYAGIVGPGEYLNIQHPREDIFFCESSRFLKDIQPILEASTCPEETLDQKCHIMEQRKAFDECSATFKWSRILNHLNERLGAVTVSAWFDEATVKEFSWNNLVIDAGSHFRCDVIRRRCLDYIRDALAELYSCHAEVTVVFPESTVESDDE